MLANIDSVSCATDAAARIDRAPVGLVDDYLYATLVRPLRPTSLNATSVHLAYGPHSGDPRARGTVIDAPA
jgi:hypothetical protein